MVNKCSRKKSADTHMWVFVDKSVMGNDQDLFSVYYKFYDQDLFDCILVFHIIYPKVGLYY